MHYDDNRSRVFTMPSLMKHTPISSCLIRSWTIGCSNNRQLGRHSSVGRAVGSVPTGYLDQNNQSGRSTSGNAPSNQWGQGVKYVECFDLMTLILPFFILTSAKSRILHYGLTLLPAYCLSQSVFDDHWGASDKVKANSPISLLEQYHQGI